MKKDAVGAFEHMVKLAKEEPPPAVSVSSRVMRRIRARATAAARPDRTLTFLAAASCAAALFVVAFGMFWLTDGTTDPLETLFQMVPPIGLQ